MDRDTLIGLLEPEIEGLGFELVHLMYRQGHGSAMLRLYIDKDEGVDVDDCETVSNQVSALLDVEDPIPGHFTLEVSSPGEDRPLRTPAHFERFAGARVKLELHAARDGRRRFTGQLVGMSDGLVELEVDGETHRFRPEEIDMARLVPSR